MKKTRKILSLVALLLASVTLFTACGVNYRTADAADYVTIGEKGYKNVALSVNKTIITERDIDKALFALRFENKTEIKEDATDGKVKQYDVVDLRLAIYDDKKNLVFSQFGIDATKYNEKDSNKKPLYTVAPVGGLSLAIGYGEFAHKEITLDSGSKLTLPVEFLKGLENALYPSENAGLKAEDHQIKGLWKDKEKTQVAVDTPVPYLDGFFTVTYTPGYEKDGVTNPGTSTGPVTIDTYMYEGKEQGTNSYTEAIYLGLAKYAEKHDLYCKGNGSPILIHVVPTASTEALPEGDASSVYIKYDLDFEDPKKTNYKAGTISTSLVFAYIIHDTAGEGAAEPLLAKPIPGADGKELTWTPGSTYEGEYKSGTTTEKMAGKTFTVRAYIEKRTAYDFATEDADVAKLIKEKGGHDHIEGLTGTDADVISKYRDHLMEEMQEAADEDARLTAMTLLWQQAVKLSSADGKKSSHSFAKAYRNDEVEYLKYLYYDMGYSGRYDSFKEFAVSYANMGYDSHYTALLESYLTPDKDGKYKLPLEKNDKGENTRASIKAAYKQLESIFYQEGLKVAKERALTYLLADLLGVRLDEDALQAKLDEAVKKKNDETKETIRDTVTVDAGETEKEVKTELVNALSNGTNKTLLEKMTVKELASAYLRYYYGVDSVDKLPADLVTEESYLSVTDKESLFGGYQLDAVKEALFKTNESTITFVEVDTDGNKLDKKTDSK